MIKRKTAIGYKTEEKTVMRGYELSELAEEGYSFYDAMFILYQGRIPTSITTLDWHKSCISLVKIKTGERLDERAGQDH
ncbi:MAG: hypothetical protein A2Z14_18435 [Chloroflexi bacterium RBG_16_48_8]|nr:MAG: hypothetical protein A2Z14_18435 [Chloroflexi bacterium RBG_16_48_8]